MKYLVVPGWWLWIPWYVILNICSWNISNISLFKFRQQMIAKDIYIFHSAGVFTLWFVCIHSLEALENEQISKSETKTGTAEVFDASRAFAFVSLILLPYMSEQIHIHILLCYWLNLEYIFLPICRFFVCKCFRLFSA